MTSDSDNLSERKLALFPGPVPTGSFNRLNDCILVFSNVATGVWVSNNEIF